MMATNYSFGIERNEDALNRNDRDHTKWTNPLEVKCALTIAFAQLSIELTLTLGNRLPNAPSMKMFCVYGHGKETEVKPIVVYLCIMLTTFLCFSAHIGTLAVILNMTNLLPMEYHLSA